MVVKTGDQVFIMEFKMAESNDGASVALDAAVAQTRGRSYADRYRECGKPVYLVGIACGREARTLLDVRAELL